MINLFVFLCSLFINFGAIGYGNFAPDHQYIVDEIQEKLAGGNSWQQSYARVSDEYWLVYLLEDGTYRAFIPWEIPEPNYSSSIIVNSLIDDIGLNVTFYNYVLMNYDGSRVAFEWPSSYNFSFYYYNADEYYYPRLLYVGRESFYYDGEFQVDMSVDDPLTPPVFTIGSLSVAGHSLNLNPLDELDNFSWSSSHGSLSLTGHSLGVSQNNSSFDFTNPLQNLLGQIVDNSNTVIGNLKGIGDYLGGIASNIREGFSAVFNAISGFNNNIINFFSYLTSVPTKEEIINSLDECENIGILRDLSESVNIWDEIGLSQVNSAPTYTFNFAGTMFDTMGNFTINFGFLDSTKNIWQPLFIALLYFNLLITLLVGLPDLIQGRGAT